jgi:hypothetical protein
MNRYLIMTVASLGWIGSFGIGEGRAAVVAEFDAAGEFGTPVMASPPWMLKGHPMENENGVLIQSGGTASVEGISSYYLSPELNGLVADGSRDYGIEFRIRPLADMPAAGNSHYANLMVGWSDREHGYNISIDRSTTDGGDDATMGGLHGGGNKRMQVAGDIDWSEPHTVFIGYKSAEKQFFIYVDGKEVTTLSPDMLGADPEPAFVDRVAFGDGTAGQGGDLRAEWYLVKVHDSSSPN